MLAGRRKGEEKMDKKISIRLREDEYEKLSKCAKEKKKSMSELIRGRALMEPDKGSVAVTDEMKMQLLNIKRHISRMSASYPNLDFKPMENAMEVLWDELY